MLLLTSPLLAIAGFYDPPFLVRAEETIRIEFEDSEERLEGRMDILALKEDVWVVVLESKKTALSAWSALPQTLAHLSADPQARKPSLGMVTNGDDIFFIKLVQQPEPQYALSRVFAPFAASQELQEALCILKAIGCAI